MDLASIIGGGIAHGNYGYGAVCRAVKRGPRWVTLVSLMFSILKCPQQRGLAQLIRDSEDERIMKGLFSGSSDGFCHDQSDDQIGSQRTKERNMRNFIKTPTISAAAAFGAAALFSMLSFGSSAEAASVLSCKGATASKVKSCCEKIVKEYGRPIWMIKSDTSCSEAAACKGGASPLALVAVVAQRCYIKRAYEIRDENHDKPEKGNQRPS